MLAAILLLSGRPQLLVHGHYFASTMIPWFLFFLNKPKSLSASCFGTTGSYSPEDMKMCLLVRSGNISGTSGIIAFASLSGWAAPDVFLRSFRHKRQRSLYSPYVFTV